MGHFRGGNEGRDRAPIGRRSDVLIQMQHTHTQALESFQSAWISDGDFRPAARFPRFLRRGSRHGVANATSLPSLPSTPFLSPPLYTPLLSTATHAVYTHHVFFLLVFATSSAFQPLSLRAIKPRSSSFSFSSFFPLLPSELLSSNSSHPWSSPIER